MKKNAEISNEEFEALLGWLAGDSDDAGLEYEKIREGLKRFFHFRGCSDPENLTDETINRVAKKIETLDFSQNKSKITIFQGFALNVYREYVREIKKEVQLIPEIPFRANVNDEMEDDPENNQACLENCLKNLTKSDRKLILQYFSKEKGAKIEFRKKIAKNNKITPNALHVRVFRIKNELRECIKDCKKRENL